jgi:hypothetical protein
MSGDVQYWIHRAWVCVMEAAPMSGRSQAWVDQGRRRRRGSKTVAATERTGMTDPADGGKEEI